jgi:aspartate 1-decarboxylase
MTKQSNSGKFYVPPAALKCAQERDSIIYIYIYMQERECASTVPSGWIP